MEFRKKLSAGQSGDDGQIYFRNKRFEIRITEDEYNKIEKMALKSGENSMASFARSLLLSGGLSDKKSKKNEKIDRLKCLGELGKIGNNVNQIAKNLNQHTALSIGVFEEVQAIRKSLDEIIRKI